MVPEHKTRQLIQMVLFVLILIVLVNKYLYKSYLNPVFLQSLLWLVYYIILLGNIEKYDMYIGDIHPFLVLQLLGFSLGGFLNYLVVPKALMYKVPPNEPDLYLVRQNVDFLFPLVTVILIICLIALSRQTGSLSIFSIADLRSELTEDDGKQYGLFGTIQFLLSIYFLLYFSAKQKNHLRYILLLILFFYFTLLLGSRQSFLFFFGSLMYILLWQKRISKTYLFLFIVILLSFFVALTYLRAHDENDDNLLLTIFLAYTVTSLPALAITSPKAGLIIGTYTFRNFYLWLNKAGFSFYIVPIISEFVSTPYYTNVFSYVKPYYYDFGYAGVFIMPTVLGFISNWLYFTAAKGKIGTIVLMALFTYPLVMQIFDELYFTWFSNWIYFSVFILVLTKFKIYEIGRSHRNVSPVA